MIEEESDFLIKFFIKKYFSKRVCYKNWVTVTTPANKKSIKDAIANMDYLNLASVLLSIGVLQILRKYQRITN